MENNFQFNRDVSLIFASYAREAVRGKQECGKNKRATNYRLRESNDNLFRI